MGTCIEGNNRKVTSFYLLLHSMYLCETRCDWSRKDHVYNAVFSEQIGSAWSIRQFCSAVFVVRMWRVVVIVLRLPAATSLRV